MAAAVQPLWRDLMAQGCHRMRALPSPQNACIAFATDCMHDLAIECMLDLFLQRAWKAVVLLPVGAGTLCLGDGVWWRCTVTDCMHNQTLSSVCFTAGQGGAAHVAGLACFFVAEQKKECNT
eukprot:scaffold57521_cov23-Tisochrysis_lutea.AAC.1